MIGAAHGVGSRVNYLNRCIDIVYVVFKQYLLDDVIVVFGVGVMRVHNGALSPVALESSA